MISCDVYVYNFYMYTLYIAQSTPPSFDCVRGTISEVKES